MGKRGTKLKPVELRELHGTDSLKVGKGHKRDVSETPRPQLGTIKPPSWLSTEAETWFNSRSPELVRLGLLTETDVEAFAQVSHYATETHRLTDLIRDEGDLIPAGKDSYKGNPLVNQRNKAAELFSKFAMRFGMSPSDRVGLLASPNEPDDEEAQVFGKNVVALSGGK